MKTCLLTFYLFFSMHLFGQLSISAGTNFRFEPRTYEKYPGLNSYYFFSLDKRLNNWMLNADFMFLQEDGSIEKHESKVVKSGNGSITFSDTRITYKADVKYSYAALKFGASHIFPDKRGKFSNLIGFYGQVDYLILEKERNHITETTVYYPNNKTFNVSTATVDVASMNKFIYSIGFQLKPRFTLSENLFLELNFSAGAFYKQRIIKPEYKNNGKVKIPLEGFLEAGLKIGYTF